MFPDLETDVLLGVKEVVHHLVVDLEIAHGHEALCAVRRQPLEQIFRPTRRQEVGADGIRACVLTLDIDGIHDRNACTRRMHTLIYTIVLSRLRELSACRENCGTT